jgi:hypothetical protein
LAPTIRDTDVWNHYSDTISADASQQDVEPWVLAAVLAHESSGGQNNGPGPFLFENVKIALVRLGCPSASMGVGRVELARAQELQAAGKMPKASREDTIRQLLDDRTNIAYAAAELGYIKEKLTAAGIDPTPEALIGAYNVGVDEYIQHPNGPHAQEYLREVQPYVKEAQEQFSAQASTPPSVQRTTNDDPAAFCFSCL